MDKETDKLREIKESEHGMRKGGDVENVPTIKMYDELAKGYDNTNYGKNTEYPANGVRVNIVLKRFKETKSKKVKDLCKRWKEQQNA